MTKNTDRAFMSAKGKTFKPLDDAFRVLAWGCGTPSTTLGVMSALGDLEPLDAIIHADTGFEASETVEMRQWYAEWFRSHGLRVEIVSGGDIRQDGAIEHIHVPFFTSDGGPLQRQCTRHFKLTPNKRRVRELLGYHATKPPHPPAASVENWLGYTLEEYTRLSDSRVQFIVNRFPFIEQQMTRQDCTNYLQDHGLPVPPKSACLCCPYRQASEWLYLRENCPEDWKAAVEFDEANRHNPLAEHGKSTADSLYVYKHDPIALDEADLEADAERERQEQGFQPPLMCGDGPCFT